nr:helix-turn-helix domain-containing protein [Lachnospiraceae bacterium]
MSVSIGEVIKYCRNRMGLTQKELATDQISVRYIGKIEKGTANITIE